MAFFERYLFPIGYGVIFLFVAYFSIRGFYAFEMMGDGFFYFNALRNFVQGEGLRSDPYVGYLLGLHAYVSLLLLSPFVWLFNSPIVMLCASLFAWLSASVLVYLCAKEILESTTTAHSSFFSGLLALFYATIPVVMEHAAPNWVVFQPDYLWAPLTLGMFYAVLKERRGLLYFCFVLLILTKESYVLLAPLNLVWILVSVRYATDRTWFSKIEWRNFAMAWLLATIVSLSLYFYNRSFNPLGIGAQILSFRNLLGFVKPHYYLWMLDYFTKLSFSLFPLLAYFLVVRSKKSIWLILSCFLFVYVGREFLNVAVYSRPMTLFFHTRVVLMPATVITLLLCFYCVSNENRFYPRAFSVLLLGGLLLNVVGIKKLYVSFSQTANLFLRHPAVLQNRTSEIESLKAHFPRLDNPSGKETIILSGGLEQYFSRYWNYIYDKPFITNYAQVGEGVQRGVLRKDLIRPVNIQSPEHLTLFWNLFEVTHESQNYVVVQRKKLDSTSLIE